MRNLSALLLFFGFLWWYFSSPETESIVLSDGSLEYPGYTFSAEESFTIEGRVLSRKEYSMGREAELSPMDLAMGWGRMADEEVVSHFDVGQRNRWYFWDAEELPIPRSEIQSSSANMHIVPANEMVERDLRRVKTDDLIRLSGRLVDINASDGWRWRSSRSRTDTGKGACELLLLSRIDWI